LNNVEDVPFTGNHLTLIKCTGIVEEFLIDEPPEENKKSWEGTLTTLTKEKSEKDKNKE